MCISPLQASAKCCTIFYNFFTGSIDFFVSPCVYYRCRVICTTK
nr:MAG TPA: hypothetical protein [Bacteriophage sp.]